MDWFEETIHIFLKSLRTTNQLESLKDFISNFHSTIKLSIEQSLQDIYFLDMKINTGAESKSSTAPCNEHTYWVAFQHSTFFNH